MTVERRDPKPHDVVIDISFCGVCHSDIHQARDEWSGGLFPMVPGHEIVGRVARVGRDVSGGRRLAGSLIGGVSEMLDHCGEHGIVSDVEVIPIQKINEAYERVLKSEVRYRFVIDIASLRA